MEIRQAVLSDADAIGMLWYQLSCYHEPFGDYYAVRDGGQSVILDYVYDLLQHESICFVAEVDSFVVGFVIGYFVVRTPHLRVAKVGKIDNIFVLPHYRRKNIGRSLIGALCDYFSSHGVVYVELSCDLHNQDALRLYSRLGFIEQKVLLIKRLE